MSRLLLASDLDRTLLPNGPQPESPGARELLRRLVEGGDIDLVFVSGRDLGLVTRAMDEYALPRPQFVIGDVGTTIYDAEDGAWRIDCGWSSLLASRWRGIDHDGLAALLAPIGELTMQEPEKQNTFKLSFHAPADAARADVDAAVKERLDAAGIEANRVWSIDDAAGVALLDVLPAGASKLHALEFLRGRLGIDRDRTLFAGDSGNDLEVLASKLPAVLVANALPEVAREALSACRRNNTCEYLYLARGGFLGMNGNYTAGILEGLAHFHPEVVEPLVAGTEASR